MRNWSKERTETTTNEYHFQFSVVRLFYALIREIRGEYYIGFMREKCVSYIKKLNIFAAFLLNLTFLGFA